MLINYLRDKSNNPVGVVVAIKDPDYGNEIRLGWSQCHTPLDRFNREKGIEIAIGRARCDRQPKKPLPHDIRYALVNLLQRAKKYYQDASVSDQALGLTCVTNSLTTFC
jgi:hypothetical protein